MPDNGKNHIVLDPNKFSEINPYKYPSNTTRKTPEIPFQDRANHASVLREKAKYITQEMSTAITLQEEYNSILDKGIIVEFESFENIEKAFEGKSFTKNSELLNIRKDGNKTYATVFIQYGFLNDFEKMLNNYISEKKRSDGKPLDSRIFIDTIANFKKATVKALWTDSIPMTENADDIFCWEVWLTARGDQQKQLDGFKELAKKLNIEYSEASFKFKERTVLLLRTTIKQLEQSLDILNNIAELRKAKTVADFFTEMDRKEQKKWTDDLLNRVVYFQETNNTPFICVLDTGINAAHPLIQNALYSNNLYTINESWGTSDYVGHGTGIAGLALYGDLIEVLETSEQIEVTHKLESSKIINKSEYIPDEKNRSLDLYAEFTRQAVAQTEIPNPQRKRLFQMAITTIDPGDNGKPSSWSAAIDMMATGMSEDNIKRLFIISVGNYKANENNEKYPNVNLEEGIRDPGQAWNALTVGAYTDKAILSEEESIDGNTPVATHGQISPYTTTSNEWNRDWPLKPDIVMEGGNIAENKFYKSQADSLSLLTTNNKFHEKLFTSFWATSAASALASKMCAQIMNKYPNLRPETVRALMVHSASWTPAMLKQFNCDTNSSKSSYINLVRVCGFGVPNLTRAMASMKNDFTIIIEDSLKPYKYEDNNRKYNEMKFYSLPFPKKELVKLGEIYVEMRVTLSYFIEPNPSSRGRSRYSYQSHGLRFEINNPSELKEHFKGRINKELQDENEDYKNDVQDIWWKLGTKGRTKGSIHSDIWTGTAADLAGCDTIAVYPVSGWWKNIKTDKTAINNIARFSLLVSIRTSVDVDLLTEVESKIKNIIRTDIPV